MDKKMTSGEIAKKAGISQKSVRLYDEKGLLKPSDYSEGNYRLYDKEALLVLEKIIALKQIGFTLGEIKENLESSRDDNILETLQAQIEMMEGKRYELERAITRIKAVIARSNGKPDWDDVAEILKNMQQDQDRDDGHFFALDHTKGELDWYVKIYRSLGVKEGEKVLDLGCGFSKVWRNNWDDIPENTHIYAYDVKGSWADDFEKYVADNSDKLAIGAGVKVIFEDVEDEATWEHIRADKKYSMILAHYLTDMLKDPETLIKRAASVLDEGGVMSLNMFGTGNTPRLNFWIDVFKSHGIDAAPLESGVRKNEAERAECEKVLKKYFKTVDETVIPCVFTYETAADLFKDLSSCLENDALFIEKNKDAIEECLEDMLRQGPVGIPHDGSFWRLKQ